MSTVEIIAWKRAVNLLKVAKLNALELSIAIGVSRLIAEQFITDYNKIYNNKKAADVEAPTALQYN